MLNNHQIIESEKSQYQKLDIKVYLFLGFVFLFSLPFIVDVNTTLMGDVVIALSNYLYLQVEIAVLIILFSYLSLTDDSGGLLSVNFIVIGFISIGVLFLFELFAPFIFVKAIFTFGYEGYTEIKTDFSNIKQIITDSGLVNFVSYPITFVLCWITMKTLALKGRLTGGIFVVYFIFMYFIVSVIVFNQPNYFSKINASLSDLFVIDYTFLEYVHWFTLLVFTIKNIYIYANESMINENPIKTDKWFFFLAILIIALNVVKTLYVLDAKPPMIETFFIFVMTWVVTLSFQNINVSLSYFSRLDEVSRKTKYAGTYLVLALLTITIALIWCEINYNLSAQLANNSLVNIILIIAFGLLSLGLVRFYEILNENVNEEFAILKIFTLINITVFLLFHIDNSIILFVSISLSLFILIYFMNFFSLKESIIILCFSSVLLMTNDEIKSLFFMANEIIDIKYLTDGFEKIMKECLSGFVDYFECWDYVLNGMKYVKPKGLEIFFDYIMRFLMLLVLTIGIPLWLVYAIGNFIIVFILGFGASIFVLGWIILKLLFFIFLTMFCGLMIYRMMFIFHRILLILGNKLSVISIKVLK